LAIGGAVAYAGFLVLLATVVIILGQLGLPWWLAALIVGLVVAGIGYFLVQKGLSELRSRNLAPQQTIDSVKEDVEWAKKQTT
jgi:drug/metabolite transporter (DMT)-like permease